MEWFVCIHCVIVGNGIVGDVGTVGTVGNDDFLSYEKEMAARDE